MEACGEPHVCTYPVDGKGGSGHTIFQPITTSFLVIDTWPDHDGAYFHVSSCKDFDPMKLHALYAAYGVSLIRENTSELEL